MEAELQTNFSGELVWKERRKILKACASGMVYSKKRTIWACLQAEEGAVGGARSKEVETSCDAAVRWQILFLRGEKTWRQNGWVPTVKFGGAGERTWQGFFLRTSISLWNWWKQLLRMRREVGVGSWGSQRCRDLGQQFLRVPSDWWSVQLMNS